MTTLGLPLLAMPQAAGLAAGALVGYLMGPRYAYPSVQAALAGAGVGAYAGSWYGKYQSPLGGAISQQMDMGYTYAPIAGAVAYQFAPAALGPNITAAAVTAGVWYYFYGSYWMNIGNSPSA